MMKFLVLVLMLAAAACSAHPSATNLKVEILSVNLEDGLEIIRLPANGSLCFLRGIPRGGMVSIPCPNASPQP